MAFRHFVSLYLLTHLSKLRFVIISTATISASGSYSHQIFSNDNSLWLFSMSTACC